VRANYSCDVFSACLPPRLVTGYSACGKATGGRGIRQQRAPVIAQAETKPGGRTVTEFTDRDRRRGAGPGGEDLAGCAWDSSADACSAPRPSAGCAAARCSARAPAGILERGRTDPAARRGGSDPDADAKAGACWPRCCGTLRTCGQGPTWTSAAVNALMTTAITPSGTGRPPGWKPGQPCFRPGSARIERKRQHDDCTSIALHGCVHVRAGAREDPLGLRDQARLCVYVHQAPCPVLLVLRSQSCLMLEGRIRTLSGPSPDTESS
jgi:hypothetical protein